MKRAQRNKQVFITQENKRRKRNDDEKCNAIYSQEEKQRNQFIKANYMQKETTAAYATHGQLILILLYSATITFHTTFLDCFTLSAAKLIILVLATGYRKHEP